MSPKKSSQTTSNSDLNSSTDRSTGVAEKSEVSERTLPGPVVLAADGNSVSESQAITAAMIADRLGVPLIVTTVMQPQLLYTSSSGVSSIPVVVNSELLDIQSEKVRDYMESAVGTDVRWTPDIRAGRIARGVVESALEHNASLIVVGAGGLEENARRIRGGYALQILRQSPFPVFSVSRDLSGLPHRALAAIDFGVSSLYAAQMALSCLDDEGEMTMLHVTPSYPELGQEGPDTVKNYDALLSQARDLLRPFKPSNARIGTLVQGGSANDVLMSQVEKLDADMIAIGTHRPGFIERFFVGSSVSTILHFSPVSVLIAPRPEPHEALRLTLGMQGTTEMDSAKDWGPMLDEFSKRNTGRRVSLEVDELEIGGQMQASGYILHGVTYDPRDRRVDIMLSYSTAKQPHLTRMIEDVKSVAIRGSEERDSTLEVRHEGGYTLLHIEN